MHFLIIYDLFVKGQHDFANDDLATVANLFVSLWPALMALLISHGISFVMNFIGNKEYLNITVRQQMAAPYARVVLMHVTLIIGGFIVQILHDPAAVLLLFILIKIFIDVDAHTKEHNAVVAPR
jgi:putative flippase GtrA